MEGGGLKFLPGKRGETGGGLRRILFADRVTTVSPNYAREVQTPPYGAGLDGVLRAAAPKFSGILNGIDVEEWDPATDGLLRENYDLETIAGMLAHADIILTARADDGLLVGLSRAISDFSYCTYLSDLAVDVAFQRQGIGRTRRRGPGAWSLVTATP